MLDAALQSADWQSTCGVPSADVVTARTNSSLLFNLDRRVLDPIHCFAIGIFGIEYPVRAVN